MPCPWTGDGLVRSLPNGSLALHGLARPAESMDLRIAGSATPEDQEALLAMARVLVIGLRFTGLPKAGGPKPFSGEAP